MTDVQEATEVATAEATDTKRGRPRPQATIDRDNTVLAAIGDAPKTKAELVEATGLPGNEVYLSLYRLKRDGRITKGGEAGANKYAKVEVQATDSGA
jgi:predicted Rossmann fold nucleotide-binding protein DprA/Smf involved in DNA uptake